MPAIDIASAEEELGPKFELLGSRFISGDDSSSANGVSATHSGFSAFPSVYFVANVALRQGYRENPLAITIEHSDDELSWSTAHSFSFAADGKTSGMVASPKDFVRVLWSAGGGSEWVIVSVVAVAPTINGGALPYVTGSGSPVGVVTPTADKPLYIDTTNGGLYLAFGATNVDWVVVGVVTGNVGEARGVAVTKGDGGIFVLSGDRDVAANTPVFIGTAYALWNGHSQGLQWNPGAAEGDEFLTVTTGATGQFNGIVQDGSGTMTLADGGLIFPSADPGVVGAWWDDAGTLARSGESGPARIFMQPTDPGAVGAGALWLDTDAGSGFGQALFVRNATDDGWLAVAPPSYITGTAAGISSAKDDVQIDLVDNDDPSASGQGYISLYAGRVNIQNVSLIHGSADPSAGAGIRAETGSLYLRSNIGAGELWEKSGAADTAWTRISAGSVSEGHYQGVTASIATGASAKIGWTFEDGDALLDLTNPLQPLIVQDGTYALSFAVVTGSLSPGGYYNVNVDLERGPNSLFHGLSVPVNPATETSFSVTLGLQTGDKVNITIDNGDGALSRIITMNRAILVKLA